MNTIVKKFALAALCTSALTLVGQSSHADLLFDITGVAQNGFSYGSAPGADNVINFNGPATSTGSTMLTPVRSPSTWLGSEPFVNSFVAVSGLAANQKFIIAWTYVGSESVQHKVFSHHGGAIATSDDNRNNSCTTCAPGLTRLRPCQWDRQLT